eukprot:133716-Amphidinium_carterae.1
MWRRKCFNSAPPANTNAQGLGALRGSLLDKVLIANAYFWVALSCREPKKELRHCSFVACSQGLGFFRDWLCLCAKEMHSLEQALFEEVWLAPYKFASSHESSACVADPHWNPVLASKEEFILRDIEIW